MLFKAQQVFYVTKEWLFHLYNTGQEFELAKYSRGLTPKKVKLRWKQQVWGYSVQTGA